MFTKRLFDPARRKYYPSFVKMTEKEPASVEAVQKILEPYQLWITRLQEVFFFRRRQVTKVALPLVYLLCAICFWYDLGFYATLSLIVMVMYIGCVFFCYADIDFEAYFFPDDLEVHDASVPNRTRSFDEVCSAISDVIGYLRMKRATMRSKRLAVGVPMLALFVTIIGTKVRAYWINIIILHVLLYGPGLMTMPYKQFKEQIKQGQEPAKESETTEKDAITPKDEVAQTDETVQTEKIVTPCQTNDE